MDSGNPETWRWIWLIATVGFALGEMAIAGSFFLGPFAVGAAVAAVLAFAGVALGVEWAAFVAVSVIAFLALRPLANRLNSEGPKLGIGSHRQLGQQARVIQKIEEGHEGGFVMIGPDRWRAESIDGRPIPVGAIVSVAEVRGTRVLVSPAPGLPPTGELPKSPPTVA